MHFKCNLEYGQFYLPKLGLHILALMILTACQRHVPVRPSLITTDSARAPTQLTITPAPPTIDKKAAIIEQIKQTASTYDRIVENEKKAGNFKTVLLQDGTAGFEFTGLSYDRIRQRELLTQTEIRGLNDEYYSLYEKQKPPTPTMTPSTQEEQQMRLDQLEKEETAWVSNELSHGITIMMYSNPARTYVPFLIGDSYAKEQEKLNEITALRLSANMPPADLIKLDIQRIQSIEPGNVNLIDIGRFPWYRSDIKLTTYVTSTRTYNVYSQTHQIIEIIPKQMPSGIANLSLADLEKLARAMITKVSPDANLDRLTPDAPGTKIGNYFFRWEDRTKPVLDDGYPFVQVGLNGNGELLNYYDTLPLAR